MTIKHIYFFTPSRWIYVFIFNFYAGIISISLRVKKLSKWKNKFGKTKAVRLKLTVGNSSIMSVSFAYFASLLYLLKQHHDGKKAAGCVKIEKLIFNCRRTATWKTFINSLILASEWEKKCVSRKREGMLARQKEGKFIYLYYLSSLSEIWAWTICR